MKIQSFHQLFLTLLSDIYTVEKQLVQDLPKIVAKANSEELKKGIQKHHEETKKQVERLDKIFKILNETPREMEWSKDIKQLFTDLQNFVKENDKSYLLDATIIAFAQRVEHFEIATYGTLKAYANLLDLKEIKNLLEETLKEESHANELLNNAALGGFFKEGINKEATKKY